MQPSSLTHPDDGESSPSLTYRPKLGSPTRWNGNVHMLQSLLDLQPLIRSASRNKYLHSSREDGTLPACDCIYEPDVPDGPQQPSVACTSLGRTTGRP